MPLNFYDKVAKKFGGYAFGRGHVKRLAEYPNGDPEKGIRFPRPVNLWTI